MASLFLAVGTEGLSNSSRPWAGGQVANVPCVGWEPSDTTDHHNGHEVTDAITCGRGWGARFPEEQDTAEEPTGACQQVPFPFALGSKDSMETSEAEKASTAQAPVFPSCSLRQKRPQFPSLATTPHLPDECCMDTGHGDAWDVPQE